MKRHLFLSLCLILSLSLFAQKGNGKIKKTVNEKTFIINKTKSGAIYDTLRTESYDNGCFNTFEYFVWSSEEIDYVAGNNTYSQKYAAQRFNISSPTNIAGLLFIANIDVATDTTYGILFSVNPNPYQNPDTIIAKSKPIPLATLKSDELSLAYFEKPINISSNFFAAMEFPATGGKMGLATTPIDCYSELSPSWVYETENGIDFNWVKLKEFWWDETNNIALNTDLLIFPLVGDEAITPQPNDTTSPGDTTHPSDTTHPNDTINPIDTTDIEDTTGINSINLDNNIQIFPNPSTSQTNIISSYKIESIEIYNAIGTKIETFTINNYIYKLNTNQYNQGLYLIKVKTKKREITKKLIIKR